MISTITHTRSTNMNIISRFKRMIMAGGTLATLGGLALSSGTVSATTAVGASSNSATSTGSSSSLSATTQQQHLTNIKTKGAAEITRRLTSLNTVLSKINTATKLSSSDKTTSIDEVNTEITGLRTLQTQLSADTTLTSAISDAQSIISEYRVYVLVLPKIWLVKTADDQQVTQANLTTLAGKLQSRLTAEKTAGKDITTLQNDLNDMNIQITDSQKISPVVEADVIKLQPSDYNSDHTILAGDASQLSIAHGDNVAASTDAKNIITGLESL